MIILSSISVAHIVWAFVDSIYFFLLYIVSIVSFCFFLSIKQKIEDTKQTYENYKKRGRDFKGITFVSFKPKPKENKVLYFSN